jgi:hypothetical protein
MIHGYRCQIRQHIDYEILNVAAQVLETPLIQVAFCQAVPQLSPHYLQPLVGAIRSCSIYYGAEKDYK